ncbi:MAG TPA: CocE/NonD family hydrolase [Acidobacteriota bacterium]|nr:CocE/NonD family hydrolase [Acidobacteriota bacterium]
MKAIKTSIILILLSVINIIPFSHRPGQGQDAPDPSQLFDKTEVMIPMRDGVRLHTEICVPKRTAEPFPFLITRTPYGINDDARGFSRIFGIYRELAPEGFIFVFQDIRGRFQSEGQFVMQRPPRDRANPKSIDEGTDTYDTIEWLVRNIPKNNGRSGLLGISYGGWLTMMGLLEPHPALKAASEQASPADMFMGDDFHHNGAFRLSYGFEYAAEMETNKTNYLFPFDVADTFEWYLRLGPLSNVNQVHFHETIPTWNNFVAHPNYDEFWQKQAFPRYLKDLKLTVPNLNVAGWWDQEDFYGPMKIYELLEKNDSDHMNYLAVGPWNHGGWSRSDGSRLGPVQFGTETGAYFREKVQKPWFVFWLKGKGNLPLNEALTFETGSNQWKSWDSWPPQRGVTMRKLYFQADRELSFELPSGSALDAFDSYLSDPDHPVPYRQRPIQATYGPGSTWSTWLVEDQRFVYLRPDTFGWSTQPLADDLTVAGDIIAHLFASTTGSDSDWIVKLIDVYPETYPSDTKMAGYQLMIANEVFRGKFRKSFERPEPLVPGQPVEFNIDLHTNDHTFQKGHRIMVQVQSSWFPLIDRNPQKFVPNIFQAGLEDFQKATQRIYRSRQYPSNVELPIVSR